MLFVILRRVKLEYGKVAVHLSISTRVVFCEVFCEISESICHSQECAEVIDGHRIETDAKNADFTELLLKSLPKRPSITLEYACKFLQVLDKFIIILILINPDIAGIS